MSISRIVISYNDSEKFYYRSTVYMRLKSMREDKDIKQRELADYLHIRQNTYSQYENGQRSLPVDVLIALAEFFGTSTDYILELTDETVPYPRCKNTH